MITHVRIQNFRSFLDAGVELQPFSLIVGANGSGKSNLLKFFAAISGTVQPSNSEGAQKAVDPEQHRGPFRLWDSGWVTHQNRSEHPVGFEVNIDGIAVTGSTGTATREILLSKPLLPRVSSGATDGDPPPASGPRSRSEALAASWSVPKLAALPE